MPWTKKARIKTVAAVAACAVAVGALSFAQVRPRDELPSPTALRAPSALGQEPLLSGVRFDAVDPEKITFLFDERGGSISRDDAERVIGYFFAGLTIPAAKWWVNLSPAEPERVVDATVAATRMGKDLAEQDYLLKLHASSLTDPRTKTGKKYWDVPVGAIHESPDTESDATMGNVWIVPKVADVSVAEHGVDIANATLDVQGKEHLAPIIAALRSEVTQGRDFIRMRQIYRALVLAAWCKTHENPLSAYTDKNAVAGIARASYADVSRAFDDYSVSVERGTYEMRLPQTDGQQRQFVCGGAPLYLISSTLREVPADVRVRGAISAISVRAKPLTTEDGARRRQEISQKALIAVLAKTPAVGVVGVTGEGKSSVVTELVSQEGDMFIRPLWTTVADEPYRDGKNSGVTSDVFAQMEKNGEFVMTIISHDGKKYGMTVEELWRVVGQGKVLVFDISRRSVYDQIVKKFSLMKAVLLTSFAKDEYRMVSRERIEAELGQRIEKMTDDPESRRTLMDEAVRNVKKFQGIPFVDVYVNRAESIEQVKIEVADKIVNKVFEKEAHASIQWFRAAVKFNTEKYFSEQEKGRGELANIDYVFMHVLSDALSLKKTEEGLALEKERVEKAFLNTRGFVGTRHYELIRTKIEKMEKWYAEMNQRAEKDKKDKLARREASLLFIKKCLTDPRQDVREIVFERLVYWYSGYRLTAQPEKTKRFTDGLRVPELQRAEFIDFLRAERAKAAAGTIRFADDFGKDVAVASIDEIIAAVSASSAVQPTLAAQPVNRDPSRKPPVFQPQTEPGADTTTLIVGEEIGKGKSFDGSASALGIEDGVGGVDMTALVGSSSVTGSDESEISKELGFTFLIVGKRADVRADEAHSRQ
jgi:guanylate kinase